MKLPTDNIAIFADKQMVEIILRNLLSNAVKFTPLGGRVQMEIGQIKDFAQIKVKDTGVGVSKEKIQLIIKGGLLSNRGTSGEIGTGLGLNLCMEYAKKNAGRIDIRSEEGQGTEITCYLPLA